jgi:hypothetical protein
MNVGTTGALHPACFFRLRSLVEKKREVSAIMHAPLIITDDGDKQE